MMMFAGVLANSLGVFLAGLVGAAFGKRIPERVRTTVMSGVGLCILYVGITGIVKDEGDFILILLSIVLGAALGAALNIDRWLGELGLWLQGKISRGEGPSNIAEAFVAATLFVCVGAMSVVAAIESGMQGQNSTFYAKSLVDCVAILFMAASLGVGCCFAAFSALLYQGLLVMFAGVLAPFLSAEVMVQMSCVGYLLVFAIGANVMNITKLKIGNFLPSVFLPILLQPLLNLI